MTHAAIVHVFILVMPPTEVSMDSSRSMLGKLSDDGMRTIRNKSVYTPSQVEGFRTMPPASKDVNSFTLGKT